MIMSDFDHLKVGSNKVYEAPLVHANVEVFSIYIY